MCRYDPSGRWWHAWSGLDHRPVRPGIAAEPPSTPGPAPLPASAARRDAPWQPNPPARPQPPTPATSTPPRWPTPARLTQDGVPLGQGRQAALPEDPRRSPPLPRSRDPRPGRGTSRGSDRLTTPSVRRGRQTAPGSGEARADDSVGPPGPSAPLTMHRRPSDLLESQPKAFKRWVPARLPWAGGQLVDLGVRR
jgi:hypothetical protein